MKRVRGDTFLSGMRHQRGFTLMEVMIVTAIIGTLTAIAIPNILRYRDNSRLRAAASEMLSTFRKAQIAAVKRNFDTILLFNSPTAGTTTVFLNNNPAINTIQDAGEPTLEVFTLPVGCSMPAANITFAGSKTGYTPRGLPSTGLSPVGESKIEIHPTSGSNIRYKAILSIAGHSSIQVSTDSGAHWE